MKPPVDAPTSTQSSPAGSTPIRSSPWASFSPPRETNSGALDDELGVLRHLLAGLVVARDETREHERLGLRPRLCETPLHEENVEPFLHGR